MTEIQSTDFETSFLVSYARDMAVKAHGLQKDKQGNPYAEHLDAVAKNVAELCWAVEGFANVDLLEDHVVVAYLHDTVEDTSLTLTDLSDLGFSPWVCEAVEALTKKKNEYNPSYIKRVIDGGLLSMRVKLADLYHNTEPARIETLPTYTQERLLAKYTEGVHRIETELAVPLTYTEEEVAEAKKKYSKPYKTYVPSSTYYPRKMSASILRIGDKVKGHGEVAETRDEGDGTTWVRYISGDQISYGKGTRVDLI